LLPFAQAIENGAGFSRGQPTEAGQSPLEERVVVTGHDTCKRKFSECPVGARQLLAAAIRLTKVISKRGPAYGASQTVGHVVVVSRPERRSQRQVQFSVQPAGPFGPVKKTCDEGLPCRVARRVRQLRTYEGHNVACLKRLHELRRRIRQLDPRVVGKKRPNLSHRGLGLKRAGAFGHLGCFATLEDEE
jgi:hypothetical protein